MNVGIIGAGYVGLVTGVCLAEIGHDVVCVDVDESKIEKLRNGEIPIYEPGLDVILAKAIKNGKIKFTTSIAEATEHALAMFIAVGTPSKDNGDADLNYVENCARQIAENMTSYKLVVEKSTVPAQTGNRIQRTIQITFRT